MKTKIQIEDVQRLVAHPGDTVLVTVNGPLDMATADHIKKVFREAFPDGVKVLVKPVQIDVRVVAGA